MSKVSTSVPDQADPRPIRVTKSNTLITASYRLTLNEQRLILAAISQIDPRKGMPKKISVSALLYSEIYGVQLRHAYEQMKETADVLFEREVKTFDGSAVERKRWVDAARYIAGEGRVELSFTIHVMPYLSRLHTKLTSYDLRRVARLDSTHSFRLFEMLMQFKKTGWAYIEIETLRTALGLSDAYQRFNNLRQRVIDPAVEELRTKSRLDVTYELKREARRVVAIKFMFKDLAQQLPLNLGDEELVPLTEIDLPEDPSLLLASAFEDLSEDDPNFTFPIDVDESGTT